jgi:hypothetical protein
MIVLMISQLKEAYLPFNEQAFNLFILFILFILSPQGYMVGNTQRGKAVDTQGTKIMATMNSVMVIM